MRRAGQSLLDTLEVFETHQTIVASLAKRNVPLRSPDVACIDGLRQNLGHERRSDRTFRVLWKARLGFEEPLHLGLRAESPGSETFHGFLNDRCDWFVPHEDASLAGLENVLQAHAADEWPIAVEQTTALAVFGLLRVLLALMLRDSDFDIQTQLGVSVIAKIFLGTFQPTSGFRYARAEFPESWHVAREAVQIIDDDDDALAPALADIVEQRVHRGAVIDAACHVVAEYFLDIVATMLRILTTDGLLRIEAVALCDLVW